ncbi:MAG TPA: GNAT family N-acetyltransferase, partial [Vibrio sp.]|nr:GNAT family N-acetyltransferase [Vibrio sp.]
GFKVVNEQEVEMRGVKLTNYVMEKVVPSDER